MTVLGYFADAWILTTYALLTLRGKSRAFHLANALGCIPLLYAEVTAGLWQVVVITGTFGLLGWIGLWKERRHDDHGH